MREQAVNDPARAADAAAFGDWFTAWHGPITTYLYRLVGDRQTADDLAQETFLRAFRAMDRVPPGLQPRPWLYQIATNLARDWGRRRRLLQWLPFGPGTPEPIDERESGRADALGERELIEVALRRIGPTHASALLLRHDQQLSLQETAAALGVNANTAKTRLFRARKAFVAAYAALAEEQDRRP